MKRLVRNLLHRAHGLDGRLFEPKDLLTRPRDINEAVIRRLCAPVYLGGDTALCRVLGRYKMFVDTNDIGLSSHLMLDGYWEMWLTEVLARTIRPGAVVADIGANLGYFTLLMADLVGPGGHVHAFEPNPPITTRLQKSVDVNGFAAWVTVHGEPLGQEDGRPVSIAVPEHEPKNAHVVPACEGSGAAILATRRLDAYPALADVEVIKIDVEGAEHDIWQGMGGLLARSRPLTIFMEFAAARYADPGGFLDQIVGQGFRLGLVSLPDGALPRTRQQILDAPPNIDQMLMLER